VVRVSVLLPSVLRSLKIIIEVFFFYYYYNYRILQHGNMTGMVHFRCSVSWNKVKCMRDKYFQWLRVNKIYLNLAKFKSATLVVCGFLVGAHPGHFRREDTELEFQERHQLTETFPFQLSARTITVPMNSNKDAERYAFQAVAVETFARQAKRLREAFFSLRNPAEAKVYHPYTGPYQFVPILQSKEWPAQKVFQLAKVHVKICQNLNVIYLQNLQDIWHAMGPNGNTLMRGFLGLVHTLPNNIKVSVVHWIHNTGRKNVKAILVPKENYDIALEQFGCVHQRLLEAVPLEYHSNIFIDNLEVDLTGGKRDTIQSCNSS